MALNKEIEEVLSKYKSLTYSKKKNEITGELYISRHDSYSVRMQLDPYPFLFPHVWETAERIPKKVNRHIYTDTESCCFTTKAKAQILLKTKINSLYEFIKGIVIPYFQNNSYYELNKKYKTSEHSHDSLGVIEGYRDILQTKNDLAIAQIIHGRLNRKKLKIHHNCYCGTSLTLKKCSNGKHNWCYREFRKIEKTVLEEDLEIHFMPHLKKEGLLK
jgi:hypothetical protein